MEKEAAVMAVVTLGGTMVTAVKVAVAAAEAWAEVRVVSVRGVARGAAALAEGQAELVVSEAGDKASGGETRRRSVWWLM